MGFWGGGGGGQVAFMARYVKYFYESYTVKDGIFLMDEDF